VCARDDSFSIYGQCIGRKLKFPKIEQKNKPCLFRARKLAVSRQAKFYAILKEKHSWLEKASGLCQQIESDMKRQRNITRKSQTSLRVQENPIKYLINGLETTYLSLFAILCETCEFMSLSCWFQIYYKNENLQNMARSDIKSSKYDKIGRFSRFYIGFRSKIRNCQKHEKIPENWR